jgi:hypothetical protein
MGCQKNTYLHGFREIVVAVEIPADIRSWGDPTRLT